MSRSKVGPSARVGPTNTTVVSTFTSLRIDVQYDGSPQEISWALGKLNPKARSNTPVYDLVHVSRRQPISLRDQLVSQQIVDVEEGASFKVEFYDTIAGDGLAVGGTDAIQVWQLESKVQATFAWDDSQNATVPIETVELDSKSHLLWSHKGDFGEFVDATFEILKER